MAPRRPSKSARSGSAVFRARTAGIDDLVRDTDRTGREIVSDTREAFRAAEPGIERAYRRFARVESGRMRDSVFARVSTLSGGRVQLRVTIDGAFDPKTGYDYLEQSRFGRGEVRAKPGRPMVLSKGRNKAGQPSYRYAGASGRGFTVVRGWKPANDWVELGERAARARLTRLQTEVGQRIGRHGLLRTRGS